MNYQVTTRNAHLHSLPLLHGHYLKGAGIAKLLEEDVVSLSPAMRAVERGGRFGHAAGDIVKCCGRAHDQAASFRCV